MDFTLVQMWGSMGIIAKFVVIVLATMSIVTVAVTVERLITYRRAGVQSRAYAVALKDLLPKRKFKEASEAAVQYKFSHIAPVIRSGLVEFIEAKEFKAQGAGYDTLGAIKSAIERTTARQMASLRRGLAALATVGSTAPFVGLFGTTFGIINSFQGMAKEGGGGIGAVAAGIAEALITTAVGIGVAIVSVLIYNYFTGKVEGLEVETHDTAGEVITLLAKDSASN